MPVASTNAKIIYNIFDQWWQSKGYDPSHVKLDNQDFTIAHPSTTEPRFSRMVVRHTNLTPRDNLETQALRLGEFWIRIAFDDDFSPLLTMDIGEEVEALYYGQTISGIRFENTHFYEEGPVDLEFPNIGVRSYYYLRIDSNFFYDYCPPIQNPIFNP